MKTRILVTGGAGFIGSHLVDRLIAAGERVTVLDDFSTGKREHLAEAAAGDLRVIEGSILDEGAVEEALRDCRQVYHLAVQCVRRSIGRPMENHHINATGTLAVLAAAHRARVDSFLYCSSSEVYGNGRDALLNERTTVCEPVTVYGGAKLCGELYAKAYHRTYGMATTVVRPFNAYGPREHDHGDLAEVLPRFVIRVLNDRPPVIFGDGANGRDFTYVTEVAGGIAAAGQCAELVGREVNIAYGRMVTVREVAEIVADLAQKPDCRPVYAAPRPGDVHTLHADTRLAQELLGYKAKIDFRRGVEMYMDWFTRKYPDPSILLEDDIENWDTAAVRA